MVKIGLIKYIRNKRIARLKKKIRQRKLELKQKEKQLNLESKLFAEKKPGMLKKMDFLLSSAKEYYFRLGTNNGSYEAQNKNMDLDSVVRLAKAEQMIFDRSINSFIDSVAFLSFYLDSSKKIDKEREYISSLTAKIESLEEANKKNRLSGIAKKLKKSLSIAEYRKRQLEKKKSLVDYINSRNNASISDIASKFYADALNPGKKAKKAIVKSLKDGFYIEKYNHNLASDDMKKDIIRQYSTNHSLSLKQIAENLSRKYNMHISESTMRKYARKELGNVSRRDHSAEKAYKRKHGMMPKISKTMKNVLYFARPKENIYKENKTPAAYTA